jgi:hypothetical protein
MNSSLHSPPLPSAILDLLTYYNLERERYPRPLTKSQVLSHWLRSYPESWVRLALIESLYQGRYKTFSVEQLLALWGRRGQPTYHFGYDFESLVCHNIPRQVKELPSAQQKPSQEKQLPPPTVNAPAGQTVEKSSKPETPTISLPVPTSTASLPAETYPEDIFEDQIDLSNPPHSTSVLESVLSHPQLLPMRLGVEPIHQFMPEAEPIEFCEKLEAIARTQA